MRESKIFNLGILILLFSVIPVKSEEGFTITAANFGGGLDMTHDWKVRIIGTSLSIEKRGRSYKKVQLSNRELSKLRQSIFENEFSNLKEYYGNRACDDCAVLWIELTLNGSSTHREVVQRAGDW